MVEKVDNVLLIKSPNLGNYRLLPTSETVFVVEDLEQYAVFGFDDNNQPNTVTLQLSSKAAQLYSIIVSKDIETAVKKIDQAITAIDSANITSSKVAIRKPLQDALEELGGTNVTSTSLGGIINSLQKNQQVYATLKNQLLNQCEINVF